MKAWNWKGATTWRWQAGFYLHTPYTLQSQRMANQLVEEKKQGGLGLTKGSEVAHAELSCIDGQSKPPMQTWTRPWELVLLIRALLINHVGASMHSTSHNVGRFSQEDIRGVLVLYRIHTCKVQCNVLQPSNTTHLHEPFGSTSWVPLESCISSKLAQTLAGTFDTFPSLTI